MPLDPILPNNLAVANFCIEPRGVAILAADLPTHRPNMPWHAKPGCAEHHRAAIERIINTLPPSWLLKPTSGELFDGLEGCNRRLLGYTLAEGFDIVRKGGGSKKNPSWRFRCVFYGERTRNDRELEARIERNTEGTITSRCQRENITIRQLGCKWEGHYSFKDVGKRGSGVNGYVLTVNCDTH